MLKKALFLFLTVTFATTLAAETRGYIGLGILTPTRELRQFFGAPAENGLIVSAVEKNSPGAKAGIRVGDVILSVDGKPVGNYGDIIHAMLPHRAGDSVRLEIMRDKQRQVIVATAEEREVHEMREVPDADQLRAKIRELERRLQELQSRGNDK